MGRPGFTATTEDQLDSLGMSTFTIEAGELLP